MMNPTTFQSVSLYVGDLSSDVTEGHLFEIFNAVGPVALIRVVRDASSRRKSLGYAYVNFYNHSDAEKALNSLNCTPIRGRPCRIMWPQRDSSERSSGVGNIFVKNLDRSIDQKALIELFTPFGSILSSKIALDEANVSKGYGFVQFATSEAANAAIQALNGSNIRGKEVFVGPFVPRKERQPTQENFTNLFVKNLDESIDTEKLRQVFGAFGELTSVAVMTEADGKSKCFGFVNFADHTHALKALETLNNTVLIPGGKTVFVGKAQKRSERDAELRYRYGRFRRSPFTYNNSNNNNNQTAVHPVPVENRGHNVYFKFVDPKVTEQRLKDEFSKFGTVLSVHLLQDERGNKQGFGHVSYQTQDEASKAVTELRGVLIEGKNIHVSLRKDAPNNRRQNQNSRGGNRWNQNQRETSHQNSKPTGGRRNSHGNKQQGTAPNAQNAGAKSNARAQPSTSVETASPKTQATASTDPVEQFLAQFPPETQLNNVAERLYPLIVQTQGNDLAGKITGMLMERFPNPKELASFLFDEKSLLEKVNEAAGILQQAQPETSAPVEQPQSDAQ